MPLTVSLYECRECDAKFLSVDARNGHESTHSDGVLEYRGERV